MKRYFYLAYGIVCHLLFLAVFIYMLGFVGNLLVPKSIDSPTDCSTAFALTVDLLLLILFAAQHSVMARPGFKRVWTQVIPTPIERSTYVLASCVALGLLMWQWQSLPAIVWSVEQPVMRFVLWMFFAAGWLLVPVVTLLINHFDLFGLRQVWLNLLGKPYTALPFREPSLYKRVRHPLYLGWTIAFWATPSMTVGHFLFAAILTGYMAIAAVWEERDLVAHFGRRYADYQRRVPMFVPKIARWSSARRSS